MKDLYSAFLIGIGLTLLVSPAIAQESDNPLDKEKDFSKVGVGAGNFLNIPVGARAVGLGTGFAGVSDDVSALYWNPAGVTQLRGASVSYGYTSMFAGMTHNFAGAVFPIGEMYKGGISLINYGSDDIPVTTMFEQDGNGATYTARDLAIGATFAGQMTDQFSFGVTGKFISLSLASLSASGVAFDLGTLYEPGLWGMRIGFVIQNLSSSLKYTGADLVRSGGVDQTTGNQNADAQIEPHEGTLPLTFRAGLSARVIDEEDSRLLASSEFSTASDRGEFVSLGVEYLWSELVAARLGFQSGTEEAFGVSGGIGVRYQAGSFLGQIDYGLRPHKTLGLVNQITATVAFN